MSALTGLAAPAQAQISLGIGASGTLCYTSQIYVSDNNDDCQSGLNLPTTFDVAGPSNFNGSVNFNSVTVQYNSANVAFGNSTVVFNGGSVTFNNSVTTNGISNTGNISTTAALSAGSGSITGALSAGSLSVGSGGVTVAAGANVSMGGNVVHNVAAGVANTDAANVGQLNAVTGNVTALQTTVNNQATQITAIQALNTTQSNQIAALQAVQDIAQGQIDSLFDLRHTDRRDMKQGVAAAMSMANAPMPSGPGKITYAMNGAMFRGEYAVGASLQYRLNTEAPMAVNVGASFAGNKNNGVRVGVAGEF